MLKFGFFINFYSIEKNIKAAGVRAGFCAIPVREVKTVGVKLLEARHLDS
jgi:hypothetical protein